jgi:hypothetical protein
MAQHSPSASTVYIMFIPSSNMFGAIISLILLENQLVIHQNEEENECNSFLIVIPILYVQTLRNRALITFVNTLSTQTHGPT